MSEKVQWTLQEIRDAYGEILRAYKALFPLFPIMRIEGENITEGFDKGNESLIESMRAKARENIPKLKEAADQSGNAVSWYSGQSLEGLNQNLRDRVEKALKLGI